METVFDTAPSDASSPIPRPARVTSGELPVPQGPRHGERLRAAARPRRHALDLTPRGSRALCDRRAGHRRRRRAAGRADGRARRGRRCPAGRGAEWFMDYRNADGCSRRCAATASGSSPATSSTRAWCPPASRSRSAPAAGVEACASTRDGEVTVDMGPARDPRARPRCGRRPRPGRRSRVDVGNPHAVVFVDDLARRRLDLHRRAGVRRGAVPGRRERRVRRPPRRRDHVAMRVHERGVGRDPLVRHRRLRGGGRRGR